MRCFKPKPPLSSPPPPTPPPPPPPPRNTTDSPSKQQQASEATTSREISRAQTPRSSGAATSSGRSSPTINLTREYTNAVQTSSYSDIWSKIHDEHQNQLPSTHLVADILEPDPDSIKAVLSNAKPSNLTRLVSDYFTSSEQTSHLCLLLHRCIDRTRSIYSPIQDLLHHLPDTTTTTQFTPSQCEWAFQTFLAFVAIDNPFPAPNSHNFQDMRRCFTQLRTQLDRRLTKARKKRRLFRTTRKGSALCLVGVTLSVAISALVVATHALVTLVAAPLLLQFLPVGFAKRQLDSVRLLGRHIAQLDAAARGTFALNNDLDTIDRLVARLHSTVESDKLLIGVGLERGGDRHPIQEIVKQLRKNNPNFLHQLKDLEEHVCLCFVNVNRARSILLQQIHLQQQFTNSNS